MLPGMDPKKMEAVMRQMGIKSEELRASKVTIETDSNLLIIENPSVVQITMQGQKSFQISGQVRTEEITSSDDIKLIMEKTNCSEEEATSALKESNGDIAEAIISIESKK